MILLILFIIILLYITNQRNNKCSMIIKLIPNAIASRNEKCMPYTYNYDVS